METVYLIVSPASPVVLSEVFVVVIPGSTTVRLPAWTAGSDPPVQVSAAPFWSVVVGLYLLDATLVTTTL